MKTIDARMSVLDLSRLHPAVLSVFAKYRIDLCCGGRHSLEEAAAKHQLDLPKLLKELEEALQVAP